LAARAADEPRRRGREGDRSPARYNRGRRRPRAWEDTPPSGLVRDTGEPKIVQRMRAQFATWASVNGGLFLLNIATTQLDPPWFLIPAAAWGIGILSTYSKMWQAGYSWRDVLRRPPAPDSVEHTLAKGGKGGRLAAANRTDFGRQQETMLQMQRDRAAILKQLETMPESERTMLPEVSKTVDGLYQRAEVLALTLVELDNQVAPGELERIDQRLALLEQDPDDAEQRRRKDLLERQRQTVKELARRRRKVSRNLESCVLAMQNVRFDLLRLKSANINEVLGDLTNATMQARALSRDVDNAIDAVGEVRDAMR
jgi:hypothetical protein